MKAYKKSNKLEEKCQFILMMGIKYQFSMLELTELARNGSKKNTLDDAVRRRKARCCVFLRQFVHPY